MRLSFIIILLLLFGLLFTPLCTFAVEKSKKSYILITKEDIVKLNPGRIEDVLNTIPGVSASSSFVSIRGDYKVKVLVDGKSINDPTSSHGGVKLDTVTLDSIESIKVYKGSGGSAFGNDASGGVIVITTREKQKTRGFLETQGGNFGSYHTYLSCDTRVDCFSFGVAAGFDKTDGCRVNSDKEKKLLKADAGFDLNKNIDFNIALSRLEIERGSSGFKVYPTPNARYFYDFEAGLFTVNMFGFKNKLSYIKANKHNINPDKNLDTELQVQKIREELTKPIEWNLGGNLLLGAGFENAEAESTRFSNKKEHTIWGFATLTGEIDLRRPLQISLGARVENHSDFGSKFSPELSIGTQINNLSAAVTLSHTHNNPSFVQRYYQSSSMQPNPDLTPEYANNISLAFAWDVNNKITLGISPFFNRITDRITYMREGPIGSYTNLGKVNYKGVDLSCDIKFCKVLKLKTSYTYLEAKDEKTGLYLPSKPKQRSTATLVYNPLDQLLISFCVKHKSSLYSNKSNTKTIDPYATGDLRMEYKWGFSKLVKSVTLYGEIKNIWDEEYQYGDGYEASPRTWFTGVKVGF